MAESTSINNSYSLDHTYIQVNIKKQFKNN